MITKGIILAGGHGSRLAPLTKVTSKQLLPIYDEPLIYFPLRILLRMGIRNVLIISAPHHAEDFLELLGSGKDFDAHFEYTIQEKPAGIAHGLALAENFAAGENIALILGDNIFFEAFSEQTAAQFTAGAQIFVKEVHDPERFGVVELAGTEVISLEEKPKQPKSPYAQTGMYFYDAAVFDKIRSLAPSERGELEITDLNKLYLQEKSLKAQILNKEWIDAGTFESLFEAASLVRALRQKKLEKF